jgi:hypothetical protein
MTDLLRKNAEERMLMQQKKTFTNNTTSRPSLKTKDNYETFETSAPGEHGLTASKAAALAAIDFRRLLLQSKHLSTLI